MKTAVEWLLDEIFWPDQQEELEKYIEQAKKMEKQQIIDAYDKAQYDYDLMRETDSDEYYNETFKSE